MFQYAGLRIGVIGIALENTPELVKAGATAGLTFLPAIDTIKAESQKLRQQGVRVQIVLIHEGTANGRNAVDGSAPIPWDGPIVTIAEGVQDTSVDVILAGHTHRVSNLMVGDILVAEGLNAGASYSVVQLVVAGNEVEWAGAATRVATNLGVPKAAAVQTIVDDANAQTAVLRNQVIGTQQFDIKRAPTRLFESAMGNMVADAMRQQYPGVDAAYTNSGGLRADLNCTPPSASEQPCEITWGEMFSVLPFAQPHGDRDADRSPARAGVPERLLAHVRPGDRDGTLPADLGPEGDLRLQRPHARGDGDVEGPGRRRRHADADPARGHDPCRHERLHVRRR